MQTFKKFFVIEVLDNSTRDDEPARVLFMATVSAASLTSAVKKAHSKARTLRKNGKLDGVPCVAVRASAGDGSSTTEAFT